MREFLGLNKRIFPVYFTCQIGLAALTAATRPPYSIVSLAADLWNAAPLVVVLAMGSLNYFVYGPKTTTVSFVRRALYGMYSELGAGSWVGLIICLESENHSAVDDRKIQRVNKDFKRNHAMTIHLNAIALVATVWYGFSLSHAIITGF